ncbi:NDP-sugar synthase [Myxococcota bacterium]|nr:NDP-sugar synthase [Myxococcota bacterium]MBU1433031.1 NDP-sugar synthase [Myxococcota bacterium]MBU1899934.1 NDP-sugar synthase [Myxococcota bacterium]
MLYGAVLAAGLGERLRPLTARRPKPLVPIAGRPLIERALDALKAAEVYEIGVNTYHLGAAFQRTLRLDRDLTLHWINEASLQGTGGGVRGIAAALPQRGPLVIINGDALFSFPLAPLIEAHRASGAMGTLILRHVPASSPFNRVRLDAEGDIHRIAEVIGPGHREDLIGAAYTGIQIIEPELIEAIPEGPCDILRSAWRRRLNEGASLKGLFAPPDALWLDVGTPKRYIEAHRYVLEGRLAAPWLPPADAEGRRIAPDAEIHPSAQIGPRCAVLSGARIGAGARLKGLVFVDEGASVAPGACLSACVLWPKAYAAGSAECEVFINEAAG